MNFLSGKKFATKNQLFIHSAYQKSMLRELLVYSPPAPKGAIFFLNQKSSNPNFSAQIGWNYYRNVSRHPFFSGAYEYAIEESQKFYPRHYFFETNSNFSLYNRQKGIHNTVADHQYSGQQQRTNKASKSDNFNPPTKKNYLLILTFRITQQTKNFCAERGLELWHIKMGVLFIEQTKFLVFPFFF